MVHIIVAVVGATFAYFTATSTNNTDAEPSANVNTNKVNSTKFDFTDESVGKTMLDYPGGIAVLGAKAVGSVESYDSTESKFSFKLKVEGSNTTKTDIVWILYKKDTQATLTNIDNCKKVVEYSQSDNKTYYYYSANGTTASHGVGKSCNLTNLELSDGDFGTKIASGKVAASENGETPGSVTLDDIETIPVQELTTASGTVTSYYYLVATYENKADDDVNQTTDDTSKSIKVSFAIDGDVTAETV